MRERLTLILAIAVILGTGADEARACKMAPPPGYEPVPIAGDTRPPSQPSVTWTLREPTALLFGGCGSCGNIGRIVLAPTAADDRAGKVGYLVEPIGDDGGVMMAIPTAVTTFEDGTIVLPYRDGNFTLELEVRAVDGNGNVSAPARLVIDVPRHTHWGRWIGLVALIIVVALGVGLHRRRRRDPLRL